MTRNDMLGVLRLNLMRDEGLRLFPYKDTVGKLTIGYGRNLDDVGIYPFEAEALLEQDILTHTHETDQAFPWLKDKPAKVQLGVYNMAFNMGIPTLKTFKTTLHLLEVSDFKGAAEQCLKSKWAGQVGERAKRIAQLFIDASQE